MTKKKRFLTILIGVIIVTAIYELVFNRESIKRAWELGQQDAARQMQRK